MIVPCSPVLDATFFWDGFLKEDRDSPPLKTKCIFDPRACPREENKTCKKTSTNDCFADSRLKFPMQLQVCHNPHNPHILIDPGVMSVNYLYIWGGSNFKCNKSMGGFWGAPFPPLATYLEDHPSDRWNLWGECLKAFEEKQKTRWGWEQQKTKGTSVEVVRNP